MSAAVIVCKSELATNSVPKKSTLIGPVTGARMFGTNHQGLRRHGSFQFLTVCKISIIVNDYGPKLIYRLQYTVCVLPLHWRRQSANFLLPSLSSSYCNCWLGCCLPVFWCLSFLFTFGVLLYDVTRRIFSCHEFPQWLIATFGVRESVFTRPMFCVLCVSFSARGLHVKQVLVIIVHHIKLRSRYLSILFVQ